MSTLRLAVSYGLLATSRRWRRMLLPAATVATGAFLLVLIAGAMPLVRRQAEAFGSAAGISRAAVVMSVMVCLVGALEVAIEATRSVVQRSREIGVLGSFGIPPRAIVCGLMVEPVVTAAVGAAAGVALGGLALPIGSGLGLLGTDAVGSPMVAIAAATAVCVATAAVASAVPAVRAALRPPLLALTS